MRVISGIAEGLLASQEGVCYMELVILLHVLHRNNFASFAQGILKY
jgi:hypothetical protein